MPISRQKASREILRFQLDVPVQVRLEHTHGVECPSSVNGVEYRYNVSGDRGPATMYLPTEARDQLAAINPQAGDVVEILKAKRRNSIFWSIDLVNDAAEPPEPAPAAAAPGPRLLAPKPAGGYVHGARQNGHASGYHVPLASENSPAAAPASNTETGRGTSHLSHCLCTAIDAAIEASEYARQKNFSVTFLGGDIRAMANSLMINSENGGVR